MNGCGNVQSPEDALIPVRFCLLDRLCDKEVGLGFEICSCPLANASVKPVRLTVS